MTSANSSPQHDKAYYQTQYADRILTWFDGRSTRTDKEDNYHTLPLLVDTYVMGYGTQEPYPNKQNPTQIDTIYTTISTVISENNSGTTYKIRVCKSAQDNKIYHRGFVSKDGTSIIEQYIPPKNLQILTFSNKFCHSYTPGSSSPYDTGLLIYDIHDEIALFDQKNKRIIVLFKQNK